MFWPDEKDLKRQGWCHTEAWTDGPTYGDLVSALRPVLRVAFLNGYQISSINIGFGPDVGPPGEWQRIDLETLELLPGVAPSPALPPGGPSYWFDIAEIGDLIGDEADRYGTGLVVPLFSSLYTDDHSVPAELVADVEAFAEEAIADLIDRVPGELPMPRQDAGGLLWIFDTTWWYPQPADMEFVGRLLFDELLVDRAGFLRGQIFADRARHRPEGDAGPANLYFLLNLSGLNVWQLHTDFWNGLLWELQTVGQATRLFEPERRLYRDRDNAPSWLDVMSQLLRRGVVVIEGLLDAGEPPEALTAEVVETDGDAVNKIVLWVWGNNSITLSRESTFPDQAAPGLTSSVAWDYVRGDSQVKPTLMIVAGRGVAIEHKINTATYRPWDLLIYRVQDDALVPGPGEIVDPAKLLAATQVEPYDEECTGPITDEYVAAYPQVMAKPTENGVLLVYPTSPGVMPTELTGGINIGTYAPAVVELVVEPKSGLHAYTVDVHYFTGKFIDPSLTWAFNGGVHVSIWVTEGVAVLSNLSDNTSPAAGNPSAFIGSVDNHLIVVEVWHTDRPDLLPRPWQGELPVLPWEVAAPQGFWAQVFLEMWEGLAPQSLQDVFTGNRDNPFPDPAPSRLDYYTDLQRADWLDEWATQEIIGLTPAPHGYKQYQYTDSLLFDVFDVAVGFVPIVGDIVDIGEAVYAYQTGMDKWGRPVSKFQLTLMLTCAAVPFVSSAFARKVIGRLAELIPSGGPTPATLEEMGRLAESASWYDNIPLTQAQAAMAEPSMLRGAAGAAQGSASRRVLSQELTTAITPAGGIGPIEGLADDLLAGTYHGWINLSDLLARSPVSGFADGPLQTAYLRHLRRDPQITPLEFFGNVNGN